MKLKRILAIALLASTAIAAQSPASKKAQTLMQAAQNKETIAGDLRAAIELYRQAARTAGQDRPLAAQALLRLAACQEKLGEGEARKTYEEIVRGYSDQRDAVAVARQKLSGGQGGAMTVQKIFDGTNLGPAGNVSPDGKYWVYSSQETYHIMLLDLTTGEHKTLHAGSGAMPKFSPDGKRIAFGLETKGGYDLAVATLGSAGAPASKQIPFRVWATLHWFPDNRRILIMGTNDFDAMDLVLAAVNVATGETKEVCKVSQTERLNDMRGLVSPDGRFVIFEKKQKAVAADRDIFIAPAEGGTPQPLIADPSEDTLVAFTPDGQHLLFNSNRSLTPGLYAVRFDNGKTTGDPMRISTSVNAGRGGGYFDQKGSLYHWSSSGGERELYVADFDAATGKAAGTVKKMPMRRGSGEITQGHWVANTNSVALHRFGDGRAIEAAIADADTGRESRSLQTQLTRAFGIYVRPDGSTALYVPGPQHGYADIDWDRGSVQPGTLIEGKAENSRCGGNTVVITTERDGIRIADFATNRTWLLQKRTDLERSSTSVDVTPDCRHMVRGEKGQTIFYTDLSTGAERELLRTPAGHSGMSFPKLTPDGQRVLFSLAKQGTRMRDLWSVPVNGGAAAPTGIELPNLRNPRIRPDGKRLLVDGGQYRFEVYRVDNPLPASLRPKR